MSLTDEQQAIRKTRFTASTAAAYLGRSHYLSPLQQWEQTQGIKPFDGNEFTEAGQIMESSIRKLSLYQLGLEESDCIEPGTLLHPEHSHAICATPDAVLPGEHSGIQIKNHEPFAKFYQGRPGSNGRWDNNIVPEDKRFQCLLELEIVRKHYSTAKEWKYWILAPYKGGAKVPFYWIRRDELLIASIIKAALLFWPVHLDPAGPLLPPSPDCDCGACGRGDKWWVGPKAGRAPRTKMTQQESLGAPLPFGNDAEPFTPKIPFQEQLTMDGMKDYTVNVVGTKFPNKDGSSRAPLLDMCVEGMPVTLEREPDNEHDPNAVAVHLKAGQIGYIPRNFAAKLAESEGLDWPLVATVTDISSRGAPQILIQLPHEDGEETNA